LFSGLHACNPYIDFDLSPTDVESRPESETKVPLWGEESVPGTESGIE
jgi:hypothetical protein